MKPEGLRDRQRRQTHETIREAAFALAVERGVATMTVADISRAAGISQRTFFNHFRTKEEALLPRLPDFEADDVAAFVGPAEPDLLTALQTLLTRHLALMHGRFGDLPGSPERVMQLVRANPELLPTMLATFEEFDARVAGLVARRTGRAEADPLCRLTALIAAGTLRTALALAPRWGTDGVPFDPDLLTPSFDALRALTTPAADQ